MGALGLCLLIVVWCVLVASLSGTAARWPWPVQLVFYLVAGLAWIAPLKPVLRWMETGRWRDVGKDGLAPRRGTED